MKQKFTQKGLSNRDLIISELSRKAPRYRFINLKYCNVEDQFQLIVLDARFGYFEGAFNIYANDFCLFNFMSENPQLVRLILNTCEELKYREL